MKKFCRHLSWYRCTSSLPFLDWYCRCHWKSLKANYKNILIVHYRYYLLDSYFDFFKTHNILLSFPSTSWCSQWTLEEFCKAVTTSRSHAQHWWLLRLSLVDGCQYLKFDVVKRGFSSTSTFCMLKKVVEFFCCTCF